MVLLTKTWAVGWIPTWLWDCGWECQSSLWAVHFRFCQHLLLLLYFVWHYDTIKSLAGFFTSSYFCGCCLVLYYKNGHHTCTYMPDHWPCCLQRIRPDFLNSCQIYHSSMSSVLIAGFSLFQPVSWSTQPTCMLKNQLVIQQLPSLCRKMNNAALCHLFWRCWISSVCTDAFNVNKR